jgi:hypothetical protein
MEKRPSVWVTVTVPVSFPTSGFGSQYTVSLTVDTVSFWAAAHAGAAAARTTIITAVSCVIKRETL